MELYKEILSKVFEKEEIQITFPNFEMDTTEILESQSYQALQKIKAVIEDDSLSDFECVENIVRIFEEIGSDGGNRHDFG